MLGGVRISALSISSHKTESAFFVYSMLSLFLKDPFYKIIFTLYVFSDKIFDIVLCFHTGKFLLGTHLVW